PNADVVHALALFLQQLRHREDRTDAHLVGIAARDHHAAIGAERRQAASFRLARFHEHERRRAVRELRCIAGRNEAAGLDALAVLEYRLQLLEIGERRLRTIAFIELERDLLLR